MSGCEGEETCEEMQAGMVAKYPEMSEHYIVWSDTVAPIIVAHEEGKLYGNIISYKRFSSQASNMTNAHYAH